MKIPVERFDQLNNSRYHGSFLPTGEVVCLSGINFITREDDLSKIFLEGEVELLNLNLKDMKASSEAFMQFITKER